MMLDLLNWITILMLAVGLICNAIAVRHLIKTVTAMRGLLVLLMVTR